MKRSVAFEYFGAGQYLEFTIGGLRELEKALGGMAIGEIIQNIGSLSVLSAGLMIGLRHHYRNRPLSFFDDKIEEHLDNGGKLEELFLPLAKALMVTGVFGKHIADAAETAETDEDFANIALSGDEEGEQKNA